MVTVWLPATIGNGEVDAAPPAPLARGTPPEATETVPVVIDPVEAIDVTVTEQVEPALMVTGTDDVPPAGRMRDRKLKAPFGFVPTSTLEHARSMK